MTTCLQFKRLGWIPLRPSSRERNGNASRSNRVSSFDIPAMSKTVLTLALASCCFLSSAQANDWPQWGGGPMRNMYSPEKNLPDRFEVGKINADTGEVDLKGSKNIKWVAKLGSQSYGNTTVAQ